MFKTHIKWKEEAPKLKEYVEKGMTLQAIGDIYGLTRERIRQVLRKLGFPNGSTIKRKKKEAAHYKKWGTKTQDKYTVKRQKFHNKKSNAKNSNVEFTVSFGDLVWPTHCPILGLELDYFAEGRQENSPSFDRIDVTKGYVDGNVIIMSWRANRIKNDGSSEEHKKIADWLSSYGL